MNDEIRQQFAEWGRKGGKATKKRGKDYYKKIGAKGLAQRWNKKSKALTNKKDEKLHK